MSTVNSRWPSFIQALLDPSRYPHRVDGVTVLETHISWIVLTGEYAYKIKKPVDLGFLDFSTLAQRRHYCDEEVRLNRRLAPELYLGAVALTGSPESPRLDGESAPFEYAVKMREFAQECQADQLLAAGALGVPDMIELAARISAFHENAAVADRSASFGTPAQVRSTVTENLDELANLIGGPDEQAKVDRLMTWCDATFAQIEQRLHERLEANRIRECHGDLHLTNLVRLDAGLTAFDCIEFNPDLRWIDTISDIAFLMMDLQSRGRDDLAYAFVNAYLEASGDYRGVSVLDYYLVYRSVVRAKVAAIRLDQTDLTDQERRKQLAKLRGHLELALRYTETNSPALLMTHGVTGSGKTWVSDGLVSALPALRVRSDVERKRLAGLPPLARSGSGIDSGLYAPEMNTRTYERLRTVAGEILNSGRNAIVDATFLKRRDRDRFRTLAEQLAVPWLILECATEEPALRERVRQRHVAEQDASEADVSVLERQLSELEPLDASERGATIRIDTGAGFDLPGLAAQIHAALRKHRVPPSDRNHR